MSYPNDQRYGSVMGEPELDTSESFPGTRKFHVWVGKSQPESGGFWHKAGDALKKVGHVVKDALPYLAEAAEGFGNSPSSYLPDDDSLLSMDTGLVLTNRSERNSRQRYLNSDPIAKYSSKSLARNAFSQLNPPTLLKPSPRPNWNQMQARTTRILNSLASSRGLPSYEEFHQQRGVVYHPPASKSGLWIQPYLKAQTARQSADFIRDTDLEPAPKAHPSRRAPQPTAEPRFQSADEILAAFLQAMPARRLPKAEYQNRDEDRKQDLWPKLQAGQVLNDNEMKQLFLTLDIQHYKAQTKKEKLEAELLRHYAEQKLAENLVSKAKRDADGNVLIGGAPVRPEDALYFAKQDIQHFRDTDMHLKPDVLIAQQKDRHDADLNTNTAFEFLNNAYRPPQQNI